MFPYTEKMTICHFFVMIKAMAVFYAALVVNYLIEFSPASLRDHLLSTLLQHFVDNVKLCRILDSIARHCAAETYMRNTYI